LLPLRLASLLLQLPTILPAGLSAGEISQGIRPILIGSALAALWIVPAIFRPKFARAVYVVVFLVSPWMLGLLSSARASLRYEYYASLAQGKTCEMHPVYVGKQYRLWRALDGNRSERIALATAFLPPAGHNRYAYPLFGSRLQNTVIYVPATRDGTIDDTAFGAADPKSLDIDSYIERLLRERVTALVFVAPHAPEVSLVLANRSRFALRLRSPSDEYLVFRPLPKPL
jgi:hypothetical protein